MSSLRFRIGMIPSCKPENLSHFYKGKLVVCKDEVSFEKFGTTRVVSVKDSFGSMGFSRINCSVVWGSDQKKIFSEISSDSPAFVVVFLAQELAAEHKSAVEKFKGKIHIEVIGKAVSALDIGLGKWVRKVDDLHSPLYDQSFKVVRRKSSQPSLKQSEAQPKVTPKNVESEGKLKVSEESKKSEAIAEPKPSKSNEKSDKGSSKKKQ